MCPFSVSKSCPLHVVHLMIYAFYNRKIAVRKPSQFRAGFLFGGCEDGERKSVDGKTADVCDGVPGGSECHPRRL